MKSNKKPVRGGLQFERLEDRLAMAGNVIVEVKGSNIKITGDDAENNIAIFGDPQNVLHIQGVGTGVTFKNNTPLPPSNEIGSITMDFKKAGIAAIPPGSDPRGPDGSGGVDTVSVKDVYIGGALSIKGSNGGVVSLGGAGANDGIIVQKATTINFSKANGISKVDQVRGPLGTQVNIENSDLGFDGSRSPPSGKGASIKTKDAKDHVEIRNTKVHGNLSIATKGDADEIGLFGVFGFFGSGAYDLKGLTIDSGAGDDLIAASGVDASGKVKVKSGDGNDKVAVGRFEGFGSNLFRSTTSLDTGKGNDTIGVGSTLTSGTFSTIFAGKLTVKAGAQDDLLMAGYQVVVNAKPSIDGGANTDTLEVLSPPFDPNDTSIFKNWEARGGFNVQHLNTLFAEIGNRF